MCGCGRSQTGGYNVGGDDGCILYWTAFSVMQVILKHKSTRFISVFTFLKITIIIIEMNILIVNNYLQFT